MTKIFDNVGKELKKLNNIGLEKENIVQLNIQVDSASTINFLKQNVLHELELCDTEIKTYAVKQATKGLYCDFTVDTIKIVGQIVVPIRSNGWTSDKAAFFITDRRERNILGNGNLPHVGIEVEQKLFPTKIVMKVSQS